jgi:hypothetical protein
VSAIKSAVCLVKTTADGTETEESYHADETSAIAALAAQCRACGWSVTDLIAGEALIYEHAPYPDEFDVIGYAQVRMLGY